MEEKLVAVVSSFPVIYNFLWNAYRDIKKKKKAGTEVAEMIGVSFESRYFQTTYFHTD